jgi:hypothetical protein
VDAETGAGGFAERLQVVHVHTPGGIALGRFDAALEESPFRFDVPDLEGQDHFIKERQHVTKVRADALEMKGVGIAGKQQSMLALRAQPGKDFDNWIVALEHILPESGDAGLLVMSQSQVGADSRQECVGINLTAVELPLQS